MTCPQGRRCRYSDAAFVTYDVASTGEWARIARLVDCTNGPSPLTIRNDSPRFTIVGTQYPVAGQRMRKVGRTTGCTVGRVDKVCVDVNVGGTDITLRCQSKVVNAAAGPGDSGAPTFTRDDAKATLYGLLWGGDATGAYFLSPFDFVTWELGVVAF